jgi:Flp pilus assembly protein TadG
VRKRLTNLRDREDGQALVELALAFPLIMILIFGIVDFGRGVNYWNDENHIANVGARYAAVAGSSTSPYGLPTTGACPNYTDLSAFLKCEVTQDSSELANGSGGTTGITSAVTIKVCAPTNAAGSPVTISLSAPYKWLPMPKVLGGTSSSFTATLTGTSTMRLEQAMPSSWINSTSC